MTIKAILHFALSSERGNQEMRYIYDESQSVMFDFETAFPVASLMLVVGYVHNLIPLEQ